METGGRGGSTISAVLRAGAGAGNGAGALETKPRKYPASAGTIGNSTFELFGSEHGLPATKTNNF